MLITSSLNGHLVMASVLFILTASEAGGYDSLKSRIQKIRHSRGKYKYKEEVIKKIEHDHPCKLTETAVKVTFPGMNNGTFFSYPQNLYHFCAQRVSL